uniref:F-box and WD repeat domain containing 5 n=1 Tax=Oncorhynchus mykiss TaxID=8022 RepID=A0A8K9WW75_ONCMY
MQKTKYKYLSIILWHRNHHGPEFQACSAQKCDRPDGTITMVHSSSMLQFNWGYTQFSQFNTDDTLLLVSGVYLGSNQIKCYFHSSSGEIAVICLENYTLLSCVRNKPYDVFGCWLNETHLVSGNLRWIGNMTSCSVLRLNKAFQVGAIHGHKCYDKTAVGLFGLPLTLPAIQVLDGRKPGPSDVLEDKTYLLFTTGWIMPDQMITSGPVLGECSTDKFFDSVDHVIGMGLSPDHRYLYVNSRAWLAGWVISDPMSPHPIAEEIDLHVIDLNSLREERRKCFFIFLDVSRDFVASGAEDKHGYIWDHHHICLARLQHNIVVNSVYFSPLQFIVIDTIHLLYNPRTTPC